MKKYKVFMVGSVLSLAVLVLPAVVSAVYTDGGVSVGTRVDVSNDSGASWHNYTADENPGDETLTVNPGDTLVFRGQSWNASGGEGSDVDVALKGTLTGALYFDSYDIFTGGTEDIDGNGNDYTYTNETATNDSNGTVSFDVDFSSGYMPIASDVNNPEIGSITVKLKDDIPDQTVITGTFEVTSAGQWMTLNNLLPVAYAQQIDGGVSTVRIVVDNPAVPAQEAAPTELPRTGADFGVGTVYSLVTLAGIFSGYLFLKSRKKSKARN